jgi:hypothetical protein
VPEWSTAEQGELARQRAAEFLFSMPVRMPLQAIIFSAAKP